MLKMAWTYLTGNWETLMIVFTVALATGFWTGWHERVLREPAMITAQQVADTKACNNAQATTKGENDELVRARNRIAADATKYKRLHPDTCLYFADTGELRSVANKYAGMHGISTGWLRDYAALCEDLRSELAIGSGQPLPVEASEQAAPVPLTN